jgi:hypothetical protein
LRPFEDDEPLRFSEQVHLQHIPIRSRAFRTECTARELRIAIPHGDVPFGTCSRQDFPLRRCLAQWVLMKTLAGKAWFSLRLFALLPPDKPDAKTAIEKHIRNEVLIDWK